MSLTLQRRMSSSGFPDGDTVCCVCQEVFKDPRTLQCGHSFCCSCLVSHIKFREGQRDVSCPNCRQPFLCPRDVNEIEGWVQKLPLHTNPVKYEKDKHRKYLEKFYPEITEETISTSEMKTRVSCNSQTSVELPTSDPFLPCLKQIGDSFNRIQEHVITKNEMSVYPKTVRGVAKDINEQICYRVTEISHGEFGLCYIAKSLAPILNIDTGVKSAEGVVCDVCIMTSNRSTLVLTIQEDSSPPDQREVTLRYNHALSRGMVEAVLDFTDVNFTVVNGVLNVADIENKDAFSKRINRIEQNSSKYCVSDSLNMTDAKCLSIVTAFLRAVTVIRNTKVFPSTSGEDELWFLTKEQFMILTDNLGSCAVFVDAVSKSGSTVLMADVANRLEKTGRTILIGQFSEFTETSGNICSKVISGNHVTENDIPVDILNVVTEARVLDNLEALNRSFQYVWVFHTRECSVCETTNRKSSATSWCEECRRYLCEEHDHNHQLVPASVVEKSNNTCQSHFNKKLEMYCMDCQVALCYICSQTRHKMCTNIKALTN